MISSSVGSLNSPGGPSEIDNSRRRMHHEIFQSFRRRIWVKWIRDLLTTSETLVVLADFLPVSYRVASVPIIVTNDIFSGLWSKWWCSLCMIIINILPLHNESMLGVSNVVLRAVKLWRRDTWANSHIYIYETVMYIWMHGYICTYYSISYRSKMCRPEFVSRFCCLKHTYCKVNK